MIPFIGFRPENIGEDGFPCEEFTGWKAQVFQIEWLGRGFFLFTGKVYSAEDD